MSINRTVSDTVQTAAFQISIFCDHIAAYSRMLADDIYRDDIVFRDSRNTFQGKKNYKTVFWSLRFHGKLFFSRLNVRVLRVWQPEESIIK